MKTVSIDTTIIIDLHKMCRMHILRGIMDFAFLITDNVCRDLPAVAMGHDEAGRFPAAYPDPHAA